MRVNQLLYADEAILIGNSWDNLLEILKVFDEVCERRKLEVDVDE